MSEKRSKAVESLLSMLPQEAMMEVKKEEKQLFIGIPKETSFQENRVPLIPESVSLLTNHGHQIYIEAGAGAAAKIEDSDFSEAGARIVYSPDEVYKADIILKVAPPSVEELELIRPRHFLISILQMSMQKVDYIRALSSKRVTAIGYEFIHEDSGVYPVIQAMSEIV